MPDKYQHSTVENKWQAKWEEENLHKGEDFSDRKKFYLLVEFPYPSGAGLHVGHIRSWGPMDAYARKKRMEGLNVLYPMGWDAFGLPAENYAIKMGVNPGEIVPKNIATFKRQCKSLGLSFDWSREVDTTDPKYYKWTQWIFVRLFKEGLAYQDEVEVNWCPKCKTNLADEEVLGNGTHERCGAPIERRNQKQWILRITRYADRLLKDLDLVDFSPNIRRQQENWIGKSEGMEIDFGDGLVVFTTRPDTLNAATFLATSKLYERSFGGAEGEKEKLGKFSGKYVTNPLNGCKMPVWDTNYVTPDYGTGVIMGVPAHDERDMEFAKKYHLDIIQEDPDKSLWRKVEEKGWGKKRTNYHLHDWVFSRQHYWGEPIPIVHCGKCGPVAVPEKDLPVELPYLEKYEPSGTGESPLSRVGSWVNTTCPDCGGPAKRETDTMPNWAGSNWYYIRYTDPKNKKVLADSKKIEYWLPVDFYQGGFEHTTLHLLYSRFIYKFLSDIRVVPTPEPYLKRRSHGIVLGADGRKMSKSFGNVINPDQIVEKYGADTLRLYVMFMGPFENVVAWSEESLEGCYRFLTRVWRLFKEHSGERNPAKSHQSSGVSAQNLDFKLHQTIKKVGDDIENLKFNTAISSLMELVNTFGDDPSQISVSALKSLCLLLAPFAPHLAEELWVEALKQPFSVHQQSWPQYDIKQLKQDQAVIIVQVNGRVRGTLNLKSHAKGGYSISNLKSEAERAAGEDPGVAKWLEGKKIQKTVFVPGKIINFVIAD
jgi:leucyl-tRNA synthetase